MRSIITGAVALASAMALSACSDAGSTPVSAPSGPPSAAPIGSSAGPDATGAATTTTAAVPSRTPTTKATTTPAEPGSATSDLSELRRIGVTLGAGVLIDVADDGLDRYLAVGKNGVVDFTGTSATDATMMSLEAAPVSQKNRVVIKPPFYDEDLGAGSCVADTSGTALKLETCVAGRASQIWTIVPAGDSGQFELQGRFGVISVDNGKITSSGGYTGLQTKRF
ncbi:hypothetical protein [Actinoplanes sp. NPDC020271]|uniref:hypothetical protein n=1 Tax=Actinoplanes sp. NPDC020271 TaxID=3363896 RepID=UPI00378CBD1A